MLIVALLILVLLVGLLDWRLLRRLAVGVGNGRNQR